MKIPSMWREVESLEGELMFYERRCGGYRVMPLYQGRWHSCERLMPDGSWLEWAGKQKLLDAMSVCGSHALRAAAEVGATIDVIGLARCKSAAQRHWEKQTEEAAG